jgi:hypothetical protein
MDNIEKHQLKEHFGHIAMWHTLRLMDRYAAEKNIDYFMAGAFSTAKFFDIEPPEMFRMWVLYKFPDTDFPATEAVLNARAASPGQ